MSEQDDFVRRVETQLRDISRREAKLAEQEDALKKQRAELRSRAAELSRTLAVYRQVMGTGTAVVAETAPEGTIADVAYSILQDHGGTMKTNEIVGEVRGLGEPKGRGG